MLSRLTRILGLLAAVMMLTVTAAPTPGAANPFPKPQCASNQVYNAKNQCVACPATQYADAQHLSCHSCPPGGTPIPGGNGCKAPFPCSATQIHDAAGKCMSCPKYSVADTVHNFCDAKDHCKGNTILDTKSVAGVCKPCPAGTHADYPHTACFVNKD